ncbi:MAG: hypothetical protein NZL96_01900 [Patescibacteria group bacterium]|nr:hypothetical protein [Patescibacteria group bacterium]
MGKIRTKIIGLEEIEENQKQAQKEKKVSKKKNLQTEQKSQEEKKIESSGGKKLTSKEKEKSSLKLKPQARGKRYQENKKMIEKGRIYSVSEAVSLLKQFKKATFDESVEIHLSVDQAGLKGVVELPYSTGKKLRVKIVNDQVITEIEKGKLDFDVLVSHPSYMPRLVKLAKILGPRGLMPNPKAGTISENPEETAKKFLSGALRWKTEPKFPLIHQMLGKISMTEEQLVANINKFIDSVARKHIKKAFLKTTMSPSIRII